MVSRRSGPREFIRALKKSDSAVERKHLVSELVMHREALSISQLGVCASFSSKLGLQEETSQFIEIAENAISYFPPESLTEVAVACSRSGNRSKVVFDSLESSLDNPESFELFSAEDKSNALLALAVGGRKPKALDKLMNSIESDPSKGFVSTLHALRALSVLYKSETSREGKELLRDRACRLFKEVESDIASLDFSPENGRRLVRLGRCLLDMGLRDEAKRWGAAVGSRLEDDVTLELKDVIKALKIWVALGREVDEFASLRKSFLNRCVELYSEMGREEALEVLRILSELPVKDGEKVMKEEVLSLVSSEVLRHVRVLSPSQLTRALVDMMKCKHWEASFWSAATQVFLERMAEFSTRDLSVSLWTLVKVGMREDALFDSAKTNFLARLLEADVRDMILLLWSFTKGKQDNSIKTLIASCSPAISRTSRSLPPQDVSLLLWVLSGLDSDTRSSHQSLIDMTVERLASALTEDRILKEARGGDPSLLTSSSFSEESLLVSALALTRLRLPSQPLYLDLHRALYGRISKLSPSQSAFGWFLFSQSQVKDDAIHKRYAFEMITKSFLLSSQDILNSLLAVEKADTGLLWFAEAHIRTQMEGGRPHRPIGESSKHLKTSLLSSLSPTPSPDSPLPSVRQCHFSDVLKATCLFRAEKGELTPQTFLTLAMLGPKSLRMETADIERLVQLGEDQFFPPLQQKAEDSEEKKTEPTESFAGRDLYRWLIALGKLLGQKNGVASTCASPVLRKSCLRTQRELLPVLPSSQLESSELIGATWALAQMPADHVSQRFLRHLGNAIKWRVDRHEIPLPLLLSSLRPLDDCGIWHRLPLPCQELFWGMASEAQKEGVRPPSEAREAVKLLKKAKKAPPLQDAASGLVGLRAAFRSNSDSSLRQHPLKKGTLRKRDMAPLGTNEKMREDAKKDVQVVDSRNPERLEDETEGDAVGTRLLPPEETPIAKFIQMIKTK